MKKLKEVMEIVGLERRTIQEYQSRGLLPSRPKQKGIPLLYDDETIDRLWLLKFYHELGYRSNRIKDVFSDENYDYARALEEIISSLEEKQRRIEDLIERAKVMQAFRIRPTQVLGMFENQAEPQAFDEVFGFVGALYRQISFAEENGVISSPTDGDNAQIVQPILRLIEILVDAYWEKRSYQDRTIQKTIQVTHREYLPRIADSVIVFAALLYGILDAIAEDSELQVGSPEVKEIVSYVKKAVGKYCKDNIGSSAEKRLVKALEAIILLKKKRYLPESTEVQLQVESINMLYPVLGIPQNMSYLEMMAIGAETLEDPRCCKLFDKEYGEEGASNFTARAFRFYCHQNGYKKAKN